MRGTASHRIAASLIDLVFVVGAGAGVGMLMRGAEPSPLFIVIGRLLVAAYLLLRDVTGASPGKRRMKLHVVGRDGALATVGQRLLRNTTIAVAPISAGIPFAASLVVVLGLAETALVLLGRDRLGDLLAQTQVVYSHPEAARAAAAADEPDFAPDE